MNPSEIDNLQK